MSKFLLVENKSICLEVVHLGAEVYFGEEAFELTYSFITGQARDG